MSDGTAHARRDCFSQPVQLLVVFDAEVHAMELIVVGVVVAFIRLLTPLCSTCEALHSASSLSIVAIMPHLEEHFRMARETDLFAFA